MGRGRWFLLSFPPLNFLWQTNLQPCEARSGFHSKSWKSQKCPFWASCSQKGGMAPINQDTQPRLWNENSGVKKEYSRMLSGSHLEYRDGVFGNKCPVSSVSGTGCELQCYGPCTSTSIDPKASRKCPMSFSRFPFLNQPTSFSYAFDWDPDCPTIHGFSISAHITGGQEMFPFLFGGFLHLDMLWKEECAHRRVWWRAFSSLDSGYSSFDVCSYLLAIWPQATPSF